MQIAGVVHIEVAASQVSLWHSPSDVHGEPSPFGAVHCIVVWSQ
jgi:hypothetical protein